MRICLGEKELEILRALKERGALKLEELYVEVGALREGQQANVRKRVSKLRVLGLVERYYDLLRLTRRGRCLVECLEMEV